MNISDEDKGTLTDLAAKAVASRVEGKLLPEPENPDGILLETLGCFVTLTNSGQLRGCIGTFNPDRPLGEMIVQMGAAAARDPRFVADPIITTELPELDIEVSILSPLEKTEKPEDLTPGTHGIYIISQGRSGCFLPEVATDQGWGVEEFLGYCCSHKARLPYDAWKDPETDVYLFTSQKFH